MQPDIDNAPPSPPLNPEHFPKPGKSILSMSNPLPVIGDNPQENGSLFKQKITKVIFAITLVLFVTTLVFYFLYYMPKKNTKKTLNAVNSRISSFKISEKSVKGVIDKIYLITTEEANIDSKGGLETSGLLIHPEIAQLKILSHILGISTKRGVPLIENTVSQFANEINHSMDMLANASSSVKGINTAAEDISIKKMRALKNEALNADTYITKANNDLAALTNETNVSFSLLPTNVVSENHKVNTSSSQYLNEAKKVSDYYKNISDTLITTNTKINSFKVALLSAGTVLSNLDPQKNSISEIKSGLSQVQVFLDQAKKDTEEIKILSETLKKISQTSLPTGVNKYHQHNIKVFDTVTEYFTSSSNVVQGFITSTSFIIAKVEKNQLLTTDVNMYKGVLVEGANTADKADAKFISDLQSLTGEEASLTLSFWQDNGLLKLGDRVEMELTNLEKTIGKEIEKNKVPYFN